MAEMEWFIKASAPFKGMEVSTVSEILSIHDYESKTLTKAFNDITGIKVNHELMNEGLLVSKIAVEIASGKPIYDFWMNDSDHIGTHPRFNDIIDGSLTDFMNGDAKDITSPTLDLKDFIGIDFATYVDGKIYGLPDQQFANLYWFRYDWFQRPDIKAGFKDKYGYDLGVPVNWSAYEDIADYFTNDVKEIDGQKVYGHMDYGKKDPSLGWRFTDAWLSMAGNGDKGLPNGKPVDEWGIRLENGRPVGSSLSRGGDANGPAAVYALTKFVEWLKKYAPPEASGMDFLEAGAVPGQGHIAQQIFWYSAFTHASTVPTLPVMNADGTPKWRMAPSPHGAYWKEGMKLGYQDVGLWTLLKFAPREKVKAGWLYAQFCTSKTVTLKKSLVSLHLIRESDIWARRDDATGAQGRRPRRVLPQPGAQALDSDRRQRAGLSAHGAGVVAERLEGDLRRGDAAGSHGRPRARHGLDHGAPGEVGRPGRSRSQDERAEGPGILVRAGRKGRQHRARSASSPTRSRRASPSTMTNC